MSVLALVPGIGAGPDTAASSAPARPSISFCAASSHFWRFSRCVRTSGPKRVSTTRRFAPSCRNTSDGYIAIAGNSRAKKPTTSR